MRAVITVALVLALCAGCSDSPVWVHNELGMRLEVPEGWQAQPAAYGLVERWVDGHGASVSIASEALPSGMGLDAWVVMAVERTAAALPGEASAEATSIAGHRAWRIDRMLPGERRQTQLVIDRTERVVVITATSGTEGQSWALAEGALASLVLAEP